jgi:uncharacterized protein YbjT (DUF2867 family)
MGLAGNERREGGAAVRIAVAGGTGRVGKPVVEAVRAGGHEPVVLSRSNGVDVTTGAGLDKALDGARVVIDVSNVTALGRRKSVAFFEAAAGNLIQAGQRAGVAHLVVLSIVGIDRVDTGYYAGKRRQEELALSGGIPASVLRATQFHEFIAQLLERERGPVALVPRMLSQPIAAREVASALVDLALGAPAGMAPEIAGPEPLEMTDMARRFVAARGLRRMVVPVRVPGTAGRAMASGALLPTGPGLRGQETFGEWLTGLSPAAGQP